ncbi:MAG: serine hydrolase domain-containing protein [Promethearchaeota archaeon]
MSRILRFLIPIIILLTISPCLFVSPNASYCEARTPDYWPTDGWRFSTPEVQGMLSSHLVAMRNFLNTYQIQPDSVLIIRNGYIVYEDYPTGHNENMRHVLFSCTKSVASAVLGIALEQGFFNGTQDRLLDFFPDRTIANPDPRKERITVENLLTMKAGFEWDEWSVSYEDANNPVFGLMSSLDAIQYMLDLPMAAEPGTTWVYNSGVSHLLSCILNATTGRFTADFAQEYLFDPLGIMNVYWESDFAGANFGGFGLHLTPRDMAKFGYVYLNNGTWDGVQILPPSWIDASIAVNHTTGSNLGYGYQWWINPDWEAFSARGYRGQRIHVLPNENLVVVFTASESQVHYDALIEDYIMPAINEFQPIIFTPLTIGLIVMMIIGIPLTLGGVYLRQKRYCTSTD